MAVEWNLDTNMGPTDESMAMISKSVRKGMTHGSFPTKYGQMSWRLVFIGFDEPNMRAIADGIARGQDSGVDVDGGVKLKGRIGTWHQIDQWNGYILWEHDIFGDDAEFIVTDNLLNEWNQGYDSIQVQLSDIFGSRIPPAWSKEAKQMLDEMRRREIESELEYQRIIGRS